MSYGGDSGAWLFWSVMRQGGCLSVDFGDSSPWNWDVGCVGLCGEGVILVPLVCAIW